MKYMKKLWILLLAVMICVPLAGCSSDAAEETDPDAEAEVEVEEEEDYSTDAPENFGSFTAVDMNGNDVTEAIFAEKDVTVVNVWASFCGPCIEEMPDLQKFSQEVPDNVQVIGIVCDAVADDPAAEADARQIIDDNGVTFTNLLASDSMSQRLEFVQFVPTTMIVDKDGNIIGEPIVGADIDAYKTALDDYLSTL